MSLNTAAERCSLLDSFPNLRSLEPLAKPEDWALTPLPKLPPNVSHKVLRNGLSVFVQENREPKNRAELFLVVGFGSLVEEEDERGIAHIIEHLGFSATKSYENHAIVKFLESIGAPFGACQNAYTSFDRTVYTLHVPTDKDGLINESLSVLREFAYFTRISEEDLDKERKVVLEEWRESKNAQGRLFENYIKALCKGCKWCERLPIGTEEVIKGVSAEKLRNFYRKFYHPARMAVIAVGDFDGAAVALTIEELFDIAPEAIEPLSRAPTAPDRPFYAVPATLGVEVASSTDPELTFAQGLIDCKRPRRLGANLADYRRGLREDLFHKVLSARLLKLTVEPRGARNFFMMSTETGEPVPTLSPLTIALAPLPGRMRQAVREIICEIERVKRLGFHESEVARAKRSFLAEYEEGYVERNQRASENFAEEYVSLFLDGDPAPGVEKTSQIVVTVLPSISCEEISQVADEFNFESNVVVKLAIPPLSWRNPLYTAWSIFQALRSFRLPTRTLDLPSGEDITSIVRAVKSEKLEPWPADKDDPEVRLKALFDEARLKANSKISSTADSVEVRLREVAAEGVPEPVRGRGLSSELLQSSSGCVLPLGEELILRNGLRIFLKTTDLFDDEIVLRGRRWGGLTEHQAGGIMSSGVVSCEAQVCTMAAMMIGICGLAVESLQESLEGKRVDPSPPSMETYYTSLEGHSSPVDFETLLLLLHLLFVYPVDPSGTSRGRLSLVKLGLLAWRLGEDRDPQSQFRREVLRCITSNHPYTWPTSLWSILRLNFRKASAIFNERASSPRDWTLVLVGKLPSKDLLLPLLDKYLGSIPNSDGSSNRLGELEARQAVTPIDVVFPSGSVRKNVKLNMIDPKGSTVMSFPISISAFTEVGSVDSAEAELKEFFTVCLLVRLLETRLIEALRFKRGQVYGVSVSDDFSLAPPRLGCQRKGTLSISFECDPAETNELVEATKTELDNLRNGTAAFTVENVHAALERDRRETEEVFLRNDWWAGTLCDLYFSRCNAVAQDIGVTTSLWWRAKLEVVNGFKHETATEAFRALLPLGSAGAVITMQPKKRLWGATPAKSPATTGTT